MTKYIDTKKVSAAMHGKTKKKKQEIPHDVSLAFIDLKTSNSKNLRNIYIAKLGSLGWTHTAIANASDMTRERIRQIVYKNNHDFSVVEHLPLPIAPLWVSEAIVNPKKVIVPDAEVLKRLKELQIYAKKVRSFSPKYREEAEEYTKLIANCLESGVTIYKLSRLLDVTHGALMFRLVRYGYKESSGKSKSYKKIIAKNRKN